jgi:anti-sigma B factor antagonist
MRTKKPTFDFEVSNAISSAKALIATVTGEIDVMNASDFAMAIEDVPTPPCLILDLRGLRYLDSAGFAVLYRFLELRTVVVVLAPDSPIYKAATLVGLPYQESIEAAVSAI